MDKGIQERLQIFNPAQSKKPDYGMPKVIRSFNILTP